jgi:hypothetical protein
MRHINAYNAGSSNNITKVPTVSPAIIVTDIDAQNESLYKEVTPNTVVPTASRTGRIHDTVASIITLNLPKSIDCE